MHNDPPPPSTRPTALPSDTVMTVMPIYLQAPSASCLHPHQWGQSNSLLTSCRKPRLSRGWTSTQTHTQAALLSAEQSSPLSLEQTQRGEIWRVWMFVKAHTHTQPHQGFKTQIEGAAQCVEDLPCGLGSTKGFLGAIPCYVQPCCFSAGTIGSYWWISCLPAFWSWWYLQYNIQPAFQKPTD